VAYNKVKLPKRIRIDKGVRYNVSKIDLIEGEPQTLGMCIDEKGKRELLIKKKQSKKNTYIVFIHEILEAICMTRPGLHDIPHKYLEELDVGIYNVLKLNGHIP